MNKSFLVTVDPSRLDAFLSLNMVPEMREALEFQIKGDELSRDEMYIFGSDVGVEAAFALSASPIVVPRIAADISDTDLRDFAAALREVLEGRDKLLILDKALADINVAVFTDAGWSVSSHDKLYQTDLTLGDWEMDPSVREQGPVNLLSPDMLEFYRKLLATDSAIGDTGSRDPREAFGGIDGDKNVRLFVIREREEVVAAATLVPTCPGTVGLHLLGVVPSGRGKGLGGRLHAHLLAVAKSDASLHVGGTRADNVAMHKIYLRNGATFVSEQIQLTL